MREIKQKIIWAALAVEDSKEVILIEPLKVKVKDQFGNVSTITVEGHYTTPITFLEKVTDLVDVAAKVLEKWTR